MRSISSGLIVLAMAACREKAVAPAAPAAAPAPAPQVSVLRSDPACVASFDAPGARIVDLSHTRIVDLGDVTVVGLPGAFERRQLHADGACVYAQKDIDAVATALDRVAPPAMLVAAVPPRGQDVRALDVSEAQNLGDPRLAPLLRKAQFGIFGEVWESGGRAVDGRGAPVPPKTESA